MSMTAFQDVPERHRTPDRDRAAEEIQNWMQLDEWPLSNREMGERGEYSSQHYANTLALYFPDEGNKSNTEKSKAVEQKGLTINIPENVESRKSYIRGYLDRLLEE